MLENNIEEFEKEMMIEFQKTPKDLDEFIGILRQWASEQPHFPEIPDDRIIRYTILCNKFSIEKSKTQLDNFYLYRNLTPDLLATTPFDEEALSPWRWFLAPLPKFGPGHSRLLIQKVNPKYSDSKYVSYDQETRAVILMAVYLMHRDLSYRFYYIVDMKDVSIGYIKHIDIMTLKKSLTIIQKVFSTRVVQIYVLNATPALEAVVNNVFKPMMKKKLHERIVISRSTDVLFEKFDKSILPKDFGGEEKSLEELNSLRQKTYQADRDIFEKLAKLRVNEELRPTKLENDEMLGYYGNFKKIDVD